MDPTFRNYTSQQASSYATHRPSYTPALYIEILNYHRSTSSNAQLDVLLDVGCGPGTATRDLAAYFNHVIGVDPSPEMIAQAKVIGGQTKTGNEVDFEALSAEELTSSRVLELGSVDILTAGMAAHWFDMSRFWVEAAKILKPGGTVALWTKSSLYCHPSTPNAKAIQSILSALESQTLLPYTLPPNILSSNLYSTLLLPWSSSLNLTPSKPEPSLSNTFPQSLHQRKQYNLNGHIPHPETDFFAGSQEYTLAELGHVLGTASMVTRWRDDNKDLAGTEEGDCVWIAMREVGRILRMEQKRKEEEVGDGKEDDEDKNWRKLKIRVGSAFVLLLFKKVE